MRYLRLFSSLVPLLGISFLISLLASAPSGAQSASPRTAPQLIGQAAATRATADDTHLNIGKWAWTGNPAPGQDFVWNINICNKGSITSSLVTLTDTLHPATSLVQWWGQNPGWTQVLSDSGQLVLSYPAIRFCEEVYLRVHLDESVAFDTVITNTATFSASNDMESDDNTAPLVNGEYEIFGQRLTATGTGTGSNDFRLSDMGPEGSAVYGAFNPAVAYSSVSRTYLVVWEGDDNISPLVNDELEIFGQSYSSAFAGYLPLIVR